MPQYRHPTFAAIDLGSNSFHMIVVELIEQKIQVVDRVKESVRLAAGVGPDGSLDEAARERALSCLAMFGQRIAGIPEHRVRTVGTSALRRIKGSAADSFLSVAEHTLGAPINIVAGVEEARLIHRGVQSEIDCTQRQLIVDIGGSSTELILANHGSPVQLQSTHMGCVVFGGQFKKADGCYEPAGLQQMRLQAVRLLLPHQQQYVSHGWDLAVGASGTVKAIHAVLQAQGLAQGTITAAALCTLYEQVLLTPNPAELAFTGLSDSRKAVFHAGVTILHSIFEQFGVREMEVATTALREGVIHELMVQDGLIANESDVRDGAVARMAKRHSSNERYIASVLETVRELLAAFNATWNIDRTDATFIQWAATLSDIGLSISHSGYHKHGAYLLSHADMAGFSQADQRILAALVRAQRGSVNEEHLASVPERSRQSIKPLIVILRLALVANRARDRNRRPPWALVADTPEATIALPADWLESNPLSAADLLAETQLAEALGVSLKLKPLPVM